MDQQQPQPTNGESSTAETEVHALQIPLLPEHPPAKTPTQRAVRKAFKGTAHLSNLLPTGTVLIFQVLSPIFTHDGKCRSIVSKTTTLFLLFTCASLCFVLNFTDSFRDDKGKVRYGVATFRGLWIIDGKLAGISTAERNNFRVRFLDFFHAFLSVLVFGSVVMFDKNVMDCFFPSPSEEMREILTTVPVAVGIVCSALFLLFPTRRHGIGFPLSRR